MQLSAATAHLPDGWADDVTIEVESGVIVRVNRGATPTGATRLALLPGMVNVHSHAFQRGIAGLTEYRGQSADSFWTWRDAMYRFVGEMTPDDCRAIAELAYIEMLESGFTRVGEFHYLHHAPDGAPYGDLAEMSGQIVEASRTTGIGLTLLPVLYTYSGFGATPASDGQRRFLNAPERFAALVEAAQHHVGTLTGANLGIAPHSLRAVDKAGLDAAIALAGSRPIHMHIAEQTREVEDSIGWSGARPVEWLLDNANVDDRWCLIHATHMTPAETTGLAYTHAVAGLCPVTEANLGDGIFAAVEWQDAGGHIGFGTDSNVAIGLTDELKQLEYSARLAHRARNVLTRAGASTGGALFRAGIAGGARASAASSGRIEIGAPADFVALDLDHPALTGRSGDQIIDAWIFGRSQGAIDEVYVGGRRVVEGGRHVARAAIEQAHKQSARRLLAG